jgi:hypothetical protein
MTDSTIIGHDTTIRLRIAVNGVIRVVGADARSTLLDVPREELALTGTQGPPSSKRVLNHVQAAETAR